MITARHLHVRAGARILVDDASFRIGAGDKVGLVGRNGAGKTTMTRILAGEGRPPAATSAVGGGRLPAAGPAHRRSRRPRPRPDPLRPRPRRGRPPTAEAEHEMASADDDVRDGRCGGTSAADAELHAAGGYAAEAEAAQIARQPRPARPGARPAAAHAVRWSAPPGRAGPDPVLAGGDAAAGRADQPPRRRLDRLAARLPQVATAAA